MFDRNRRRYEAKHGVPRDAAPPFYSRHVVEYRRAGQPPPRTAPTLGVERVGTAPVFGNGMNKTGTLEPARGRVAPGVRLGPPRRPRAGRCHRASAVRGASSARRRARGARRVLRRRAGADGVRPARPSPSGSKFVLSVRDVDDWWRVDSDMRSATASCATRGCPTVSSSTSTWTRGSPNARRITRPCSAHFSGRPDDLLVIDVCDGQGWERLAPFLGWGRIPERDFPWENRDSLQRRAPESDPGAGLTCGVTGVCSSEGGPTPRAIAASWQRWSS